MPLFRRRSAQVIRKGVGDQSVEEVRRVGGETVRIRRVTRPERETKSRERKAEPKREAGRAPGRRTTTRKPASQRRAREGEGRPTRPRGRPHRPEEEVTPLPDSGRKQMLVRVLPHQTQIVVLEGPVLVEHYVARSDRQSLVGNVYLGRVRNVLPGMEAAFVDFGQDKNGVLYAGDIQYDPEDFEGRRRPRIERALKQGDEVLVQVVKDAMGHKGARLTNEVSLPGRYLVLVPNGDMKGISRRLPDSERERLRQIIRDVRPPKFGIIVRTAAAGASREDIEQDVKRLVATWGQIQGEVAAGNAPRLLYEEPSLVIRVIREHFTPDFRRLMIDDRRTHDFIKTYLGETDPDLVEKVHQYRDELGIFERFHVEDQLRKGLDRKVVLPSGGHIVIDRTEALTVIDVNTGRFVGRSNLEETVLQNNLEAAEEIGRQLRLRDIGGIIVIDFIDMEIEKNRQAVLRRLREALAKDKTRTQVFEVSNLGLVEMTRKNVSEGLLESFSEVCPRCAGRGVVLYEESATRGAPVPEEEMPATAAGG